MPATARRERPANRDVTVNIRARRREVELIDAAADALGVSRSAFMMEAAIRAARRAPGAIPSSSGRWKQSSA